jgi:hypothetical protein
MMEDCSREYVGVDLLRGQQQADLYILSSSNGDYSFQWLA